jgi:hypothetical protein
MIADRLQKASRVLWILVLGVTVFAAPAESQLFLAWNACDGTPPSSTGNLDFDCTPNSGFIAELWGTYGLPAPMSVGVIEGIVDFAFQGQTIVPPFWHFEAGGCNNYGLPFSYVRESATSCATENSIDLCGPGDVPRCGGGLTNIIDGTQVPSLGGPNRMRLLFFIARPFNDGVTLPAMPARIFGFHMAVTTQNTPGSGGADCTGCETPTAIAWNQLRVSDGEGNLVLTLTSTTPGSTGTLPANGATVSVATNKRSWGQLKSLYR